MFVLAVGGVSDWWGHRDGVRPLAVVAGGSVFCCVLFWCRYKTKKPGQLALLRLRLKGRLPTLPLSQYHRRGEA